MDKEWKSIEKGEFPTEYGPYIVFISTKKSKEAWTMRIYRWVPTRRKRFPKAKYIPGHWESGSLPQTWITHWRALPQHPESCEDVWAK